MKLNERFRGLSLIFLALVHLLLFIAGLVAAAALRHGAVYVNPYADGESVRAFFAANPQATRMSSFLLFGSAVPLGIFGATVSSRLRFLGIRAAGTYIALFGGFASAGALVLSGLFGWVLSLPDVTASAALAHALFFLSFLFGGTGFAVGFGLLASGVSITCWFGRILPRWLAVMGLVVAVAGEFSSLSLLFYPANFLIPIARYLGLIWLIIAAVKLQRAQPKMLSF